MSVVKIVTDQTALGKLIDSIAKSGVKFDKSVHLAAVSSLAHLGEHGDIGMVNRLYLALPSGTRKAAMSSWLMAYGALEANTEGKTKREKPFVYAKHKETNVDAGMADPWFDHAPDKAPDMTLDLQKAIEAIIKKATKAGMQLVHGEKLQALQALVADTNASVTALADDGTVIEGQFLAQGVVTE